MPAHSELIVPPSAFAASPALLGRSASLSSQIVAAVRQELFAKALRPGDVLGTEKELAARFEVSRIVARDALRTLEALGIVEIRMGKGGGARIARGNPRLFAEVLAIQLDLSGVSAAEILDAQRAIEVMAAGLAAHAALPSDHARLTRLIDEAESVMMSDVAAYTQLSRDFHIALAEASHNRVLVVQLISLGNISWPHENRTLTPSVARRVLDAHKRLAALIEARDAEGASAFMSEHVQMIRSRRVAQHDHPAAGCC